MSQSIQGRLPSDVLLGDVLPALNQNMATAEGSQHLYVSLSQLVQEHIFYHPELAQEQGGLSDDETKHLASLLGGISVRDHFVTTLVSLIQAKVKPEYQHIRLCLSDSDSHDYSALLGGKCEESEVNPAIGLRGVARFASEHHSQSFALECEVIKQLRNQGLDIEIVVPFVRTLSDAAKIIDRLAVQGLPRGLNGLKVLFCCDVPAAVLLAERLLQYFDGLVVNIENLAQLTLGVDKTNQALEHLFDPQNEAVLLLLNQAAKSASSANKPCVVYCQHLAELPKLQDSLFELENLQILAQY